MFEPKFMKARPTLALDARQAMAAMIQSKLGVDVSWTSGRGDFAANGQVFCSITREGDLALKLPTERMDALVGNGEAKPWQFGKRTLENWVVVGAAAGAADAAGTLKLLREAKAYVESLPGKPAQSKPAAKQV